ncbi:Uncharacterized protein APZ42_029370 [Daphnia magna]|uniref:Uncharacterized protein n=1 Tax=Daphnia magna TaxID=35525 RepID=A0A0P6GWG5_9CRUS|nr:Uncharacterized protein APZ42_029370 [Daphnia magna]
MSQTARAVLPKSSKVAPLQPPCTSNLQHSIAMSQSHVRALLSPHCATFDVDVKINKNSTFLFLFLKHFS